MCAPPPLHVCARGSDTSRLLLVGPAIAPGGAAPSDEVRPRMPANGSGRPSASAATFPKGEDGNGMGSCQILIFMIVFEGFGEKGGGGGEGEGT